MLTRRKPADAVNQVALEWYNRLNGYNPEIVAERDLASIQTYGLNAGSSTQAHCFATALAARTSARLQLQRAQSLNSWAGSVGAHRDEIEIGDLVTVTCATQALSGWPVRVTERTDNADGTIALVFEDYHPSGCAVLGLPTPTGFKPNFNVSPGDAATPILFEPPVQLTGGGLEVWLASCGGASWGGAEVWISTDGAGYARAGMIDGPSRMGTTTASLPAGAAMDAVNTLAVDLSISSGALLSGSGADLAALSTLCLVGDELLAYQTATLTGANRYALTTLARGVYTTPTAAHPAGSRFLRLDGAVVKVPFGVDRIGQTVWIKLLSFNSFGGAGQSLDEVEAVQYQLRGSALSSPLPDVAGLCTSYSGGVMTLGWTPVGDFRRGVDYEIRQGATPASAQVIGRTPLVRTSVQGDGTYWIAAHYALPGGGDVYSADWASVVVTGSQLLVNVIAAIDEAAAGWPGICAGLHVSGAALVPDPAGDLLAADDILATDDIVWYGGVSASGSYTIPAIHRVVLSRPGAAQVKMSAAVSGAYLTDDILAADDALALDDMLNTPSGGSFYASCQLRLSQDGTTWGAWQAWAPSSYVALAFDFRVVIGTADPTILPTLGGFSWSVDVPDRVEGHTVSVPAGGLAIVYPGGAFNGSAAGPGIPPSPQVTVLGGQIGDDPPLITAITLTGFAVQITNGGSGVARTIAYQSPGY